MMPPALRGLFDDAALFPPASLPLDRAVAEHGEHAAAWYAEAVGPFVCPATRVADLEAVAVRSPLPVALTVPGGPVELAPALARCARLGTVRLAAVEVMLPDGVAARQALAMLTDQLPPDVTGYLEVPRGARTHTVLDELAGTRVRAKFRTGGLDQGDHPGERELADAVLGAVARGVPFKCTAGLHHAVRGTYGSLEQHGFLNLLLATDAAVRGADIAVVASLLARRSRTELAREVEAALDRLPAARDSLVCIGTCSIAEPIDDLVALGLLRRPEASVG